jgi:hypothetical protein
VQALLAQGLRSIYNNDNEYIKLPEAMECVFRAAIDAKAISSDPRPSRLTLSPSCIMRLCVTRTLSCGTKPWCARWRLTLRTARGSL